MSLSRSLALLLLTTVLGSIHGYTLDSNSSYKKFVENYKKTKSGLHLPKNIQGGDLYNVGQLSQKDVTRMSSIHRDTIRMPRDTPMVPYKPTGSTYAQFIDLYSAMYRERTMFVSKFISDDAANEIISIILYLRNEQTNSNISIYFNVPGAQLRPALAIYDLLQQTKEQKTIIETVNLGLCVGMGSFLCAAGTKGYRAAMPNARFLLYRTGMDQVFQGQSTDIALEVKNIKTWNDRMEQELSKLTGQPLERIHNDLKRDFYLSSDEAVRYGLIDSVVLPAPLKRAARGGDVDLGTFEGDGEQKYQNRDNQGGGGWGSRSPSQQPKDDKDDDGPEILKG